MNVPKDKGIGTSAKTKSVDLTEKEPRPFTLDNWRPFRVVLSVIEKATGMVVMRRVVWNLNSDVRG